MAQEKLKTMRMQNLRVTNKEHYGCYGIFSSGQFGLQELVSHFQSEKECIHEVGQCREPVAKPCIKNSSVHFVC